MNICCCISKSNNKFAEKFTEIGSRKTEAKNKLLEVKNQQQENET